MNYKKDFPIFKNNPDLIFLDSTSSTQKPSKVIDWISEYLSNWYSNIHRWLYDTAINSEKLYFDSKKKIAKYIKANDFREIIYTYNSNYALNIISQTLRYNNILKKWDKVLLSIVEHHANIVPWLILKEEIGIEIDYIWILDDYSLDLDDFEKKFTKNVKVVSITHVSNVTGQIFNLEEIWNMLSDLSSKFNIKKPYFIVDASQSIPHMELDVQKIDCDFLFFTWHKIMADTWISVLYSKLELMSSLNPIFSWGWAINEVKEHSFKPGALPFKFEPWTPNITWAVSLLKAFEYIEEIWWFEKIQEIESDLVRYTLEKFSQYDNIELIGSKKAKNRVWVFSFYIKWIHSLDIADEMAENNICIRAWQHCAEPFMDYLWVSSTARISLYIYNTKEDIDKFFLVLDNYLKN